MEATVVVIMMMIKTMVVMMVIMMVMIMPIIAKRQTYLNHKILYLQSLHIRLVYRTVGLTHNR